jgi:uncharacterized protein YndB with AHSA1/START domain
MSDFIIDIDVDAPQQTVFNYLADATRTPEWYEAVRSAVRTSEGATREGTSFTFTRVLPQGEVTNEVEISEFRDPDLVTFASRSGPTPFVYRYRVEAAPAGSRVTLEGSISGEGLAGSAALLAPFADKLFARGMTKNLETLKMRLES